MFAHLQATFPSFFEIMYLNAILDETPTVTRMEFCSQQAPPSQEASSNVEWTYLEPVQPSTYALASTNNIEEVMVPITTTSTG